MTEDFEDKVRTQAFLELTSQARAGAYVYLPLWIAICVPVGFVGSHPELFFYNALLMVITAICRIFTMHRVEARYQKDPELTRKLFVAGTHFAGLHWGLLGAYILWHPELQQIELGFLACIAGLGAISLSYFASSLRFAMTYCSILVVPVILSGLLYGSPESISIAIIFIISLCGLYWVGRGLNRNYRRMYEYAAQATDRAQQLAEISTIDGLTGIRNRHYFAERYQAEWKRAHRQQSPIAVMMIDIDHFKEVNDRHGHMVGDECLKAVARMLAEHIKRPTDILARYGGEEFVAVLPDTQQVGAMSVGKKLLHAARQIRIASGSDRAVSLTISIGIACTVPDKHDNESPCLKTADEALYEAKHDGRDCLRSRQIQTNKTEP